ncbi:DUF1559 domain-containing protein [Stieleria marina]|uniref:DUF1559 domain-containing protein n=1 Tax=Stieleria marina TaxID=1930275 RepID=A0A517NYY3_9BACT|nr:hypothetical protein K239x_43370 [Planctomycetes bacterium K23_9]
MRLSRFSLTDLVVVCCAILVGLSLMLVQIGQHRVGARKSVCVQNLRELCLAAHNYHSAFKRLPQGMGGSSAQPDSEPWQSNQDRLSAWVALSPFYQQQSLWEEVSNPLQTDSHSFPAMGPVPWFDPAEYSPWSKRPSLLVCPDDPDAAEWSTVASYVMNYGDAVDRVGSPQDLKDPLVEMAVKASNRGVFCGNRIIRFRDCLDGLSNTLMFSESRIAGKPVAKGVAGMSLDPSKCIAASENPGAMFWPGARSACWADGCLRSSGFQAILPPNSSSATTDQSDFEGVISASSYHMGGAHVAFSDGAVLFVVDAIDAGKNNSPTVALHPDAKHAKPGSVSPFGVWGAVGTRANKEVVDRDDGGFQNRSLMLTDREQAVLSRRPVQTWVLADGQSEVSGQFIALSGNSLAYWSAPKNAIQYISARKLAPQDAKNAARQNERMMDRATLQLKALATRSIKLLGDKQYAEFAAEMIQCDLHDDKIVAAWGKRFELYLTQTLENLRRELSNPDSGYVDRKISGDAPITLHLNLPPGRQPFDDLRFRYIDGRWRIHVRLASWSVQ